MRKYKNSMREAKNKVDDYVGTNVTMTADGSRNHVMRFFKKR